MDEKCPHNDFESHVVVEKRQAVPLVHLRVRCALCQTEVVFDGLAPAVDEYYQQVAVARNGTEVVLAGKMARAVDVEREAWVAATVKGPDIPPPEEDLQPPAK